MLTASFSQTLARLEPPVEEEGAVNGGWASGLDLFGLVFGASGPNAATGFDTGCDGGGMTDFVETGFGGGEVDFGGEDGLGSEGGAFVVLERM